MSGILMKKLIEKTFSLEKSLLYKVQSTALTHRYSTRTSDDGNLLVRSLKPDIQPIVGKTLPEFIWEKSLGWGDKATAFECCTTGRKYNYVELHRYARGFGASLIKLGCNRGDVISLILPNTPEFPIALFGGLEAGCIVSTMNPTYTAHEISHQLTNSTSKYVVTIDTRLPSVLQAKKSCPGVKQIIVVGTSTPEGCLSFFDMMRSDTKGVPFLKGSEITKDTTAVLPYSSGTTGPPKGVELTHQNLATNVWQHLQPGVGAGQSLASGKTDRYIGAIPFFHIYGLHIFCLYGPSLGAHTMTLAKFEPAVFVKTLKSHKPTILFLVPPLVSFLCQCPDITTPDLASVTTIVAGAAPLGEGLIKKTLEKGGKSLNFVEGFGMSESSPISLMLSPTTRNSKIGSCGTPFPSTVCKIVDPKTGKSLGPNQRGELCLKGPQVMKGYLNNEKATKETIDAEGWFHTGDIFYYDKDSCFYVVDRQKELIKVKGFQVSPSELEDLLRQNPDVADVAVIGVPDDVSGELPRAYIVKKNSKLSEAQINDFMKDKVVAYKHLKGGIEFVDKIPKAASGKLLRRELLADYKKKHGK